MTNRSKRPIESLTGEYHQDDESHCPPRVRDTAVEIVGEDLLRLSNTPKPESLKGTQDIHGLHSLEVTKAKSGVTSLIHNLLSLPFARDIPSKRPKMDTEEPLACHQTLQHDISMLEQAKKKLEAEKAAAESRIEWLTSKVNVASEAHHREMESAWKEIARCTLELDMIKSANMKLQADNKAFEEENARLRYQVSTLSEKNAQLRQIIVPASEKQVIDADVVRKFAGLRSNILALVRQTWTLQLRGGIDLRTLSADQQHAFKLNFTLTYDRLRFVVFIILQQNIFQSQNYFLGKRFEKLEDFIRQAEKQMMAKSTQENLGPLIAWRNAGFKATETFQDKHRRLSLSTRDKIWDFLRPIQTQNSAAEENGKHRLEEICDCAVELSFIIRQLKDRVFVARMVNAVGKPFSEWDTFVEDMSSVAVDKDQEPGTIAYVISGALLKNPKEDLGKILVLEKAHVAVYE